MTLESSWFSPAKWRWAVTVVNPVVKKCWQSQGVLKAGSSQDSVLVHHIRVKCPYNAFCYVYLSVPRFIFFWVMTESGEFCRDSIWHNHFFLIFIGINYWWHSLLVSCSAFPFILKDKAGIINSAIRHQVFFWLASVTKFRYRKVFHDLEG